ncbi:MAG TPA: precorrin-6y C5,15-methyltransferase (decarboxylating) subunit CbiE [Stellaceae bacterium]|nr:precorrin-6y C5,15-methyltransferase (decarboxylating) subunit CbiE [Stellaceae bacterium]
MTPWLAVIGIGEDGLAGLSAASRALVDSAELLVGGERHLALVPTGAAERLPWRQPLADTIALIAARRGARVVVLASGDPLCYGVGSTLARHFAAGEMLVLPQPSAFSLAAARLLWPLEGCVTLSLHGRALESLRLHLAPGARLLLLTTDGDTPVQVAKLLIDAGWGPSAMTVFAHMGGERERRIDAAAESWPLGRIAALNTLAVECKGGPAARPLSRLAGLPDSAFEHDGQLTKREIRAATLAALAPLPGELLWDIGAGNGSVAIEWLRAGRDMQAIAVERDTARCAQIARNAAALGVAELRVLHGAAPAALADLPAPDAIFIGGGVSEPLVWEALWRALKPGGRLVANAVTLQGEAELLRRQQRHGGEVVRLQIAHAEPIGGFHAWRALMPVTQLILAKPRDPAP